MKATKRAPLRRRRLVREDRMGDTALMEDMALELYSIVHLALTDFGVGPSRQQRLYAKARKLKKPPRVSGQVRQETAALAALMTHWKNAAEYVDAEGRGRALPIEGRGTTFETLVHRFMPGTDLQKAVRLACERAEVVTRPGGRIAITGSTFVSTMNSDLVTLAHAIRHIDLLLLTIRNNRLATHRKSQSSRLDRLALVAIPERIYDKTMQSLRSRVCDFCEDIVAFLLEEAARRRRPKDEMTVAAVGIYLSREDDFKRAGYPRPEPCVRLATTVPDSPLWNHHRAHGLTEARK
jgi:hypothetical protein